ncbi:PREDICTED: histone H1-beta, late embryonic-like [Priapulus caudatus]|uniref:Histone H1-beta, late embryonic-like n=1 Tax=Priapulus caudatus TaxID=37621 RepID=A0ABM1F6R9_PRICU|nr:PREDICTED: histone H1-beta, late embryonic-like [Priapulus caudatus]
MVITAIDDLKERGGSSRQAILKYIVVHYTVRADEKVVNTQVKLALRRGVKEGDLRQVTGSGASGSFRLGDKKKKKKNTEKKPKAEKTAAKPKEMPAEASPKRPKKKKMSAAKKLASPTIKAKGRKKADAAVAMAGNTPKGRRKPAAGAAAAVADNKAKKTKLVAKKRISMSAKPKNVRVVKKKTSAPKSKPAKSAKD